MRKAATACLAFSAAVAAGRWLLGREALLLGLLCCGVLALAALLLRGERRLRALLIAFGAAAGLLAWGGQQILTVDRAEALAGERITLSARVTDYPDLYDTGEYVTVRLTEPGLPRVKCRLISYVPGELADLRPGDGLRCSVRAMSALVSSGEEIDAYTAQGIFLRAVCTDTPEITGRWKWSFAYWPMAVCRYVKTVCARIFPADTAPFMTALLTGDKTGLYRDGDRYYTLSESGLAHVVAVSGMHISFLTGFFFLLAGRRRLTTLLSFPLLLFFAAMTGFTPSVTRAVFMQLCLLAAPLFRREEDALTSLAVVLALMLAQNPCAVAGTSLQLSFASMAGIWLVSGRIYNTLLDRIGTRNRWIRRPLAFLAATLAMCVGAQIFTLPLAAAHFGYVSTVSPLSGAACLWVVSGLYLGGYGCVVLGALFPAAGALLGRLLAWGVRYIYLVAGALVRLPCAAVYMTNPVFVAWLGFVYAVFFTAWSLGRKRGGFRPAAPVCLSLIALYASALLVYAAWPETICVTALDVGQGESVVITCGPRTVVVDCGGSYYPRDPGETAVGCLAGQQRRHVDALILTHLHSDHANGAARLILQLRVDALYLPRQTDQDHLLPELLEAARQRGTRVEYVDENTALRMGDLTLTLWAPLLPGEENENCLTVMAAQGDFEVLITGDNPTAAERLLTARYKLPDVEVLVAGHHGSATSTGEELLLAVRPDVVMISAGRNNSYGHPHREVLERLEEYNIEVLRTDLEGSVSVRADKESAHGG